MKVICCHIKQFLFFLVSATILLLLITGCSKDVRDIVCPDQDEEQEDEITLILRIPAQEIPLSRSMGNGEDYVVKEAVILAFSVEYAPSYKETLAYYREGRYISSSSGNNLYSVTFRAHLKKGDYKLVIIANPGELLKEQLSQLPENGITDKVAILKLLQYSHTGKWNAGDNYTPIPMYAETGVETIGTGTTLNATPNLIRMLARIDVSVDLEASSEATFRLEKIYLANYNTNGYVSPLWNNNGITATDISAINLPPNPGVNTNTLLEYGVPGAGSIPATCKGEIYTFETAKEEAYTTDTEFYNSVCLILEGSFNGEANTFYRIDLTNQSTGRYMPILRNHLYDVIITQANRSGYRTLTEALRSYGVTVNGGLRSRIISYHMGDVTNVVFDEQYMLGTNTKKEPYEFAPAGGTGSFIIYTDYPQGFSLTASDPETGQPVNWVTLPVVQGVGTQTVNYTVLHNPTTSRQAHLVLSAGRLTNTIQIHQSGLE
ncbi:MAG: hypothetical protein LUH10_07525 [Tannerellaceae bacterium]|nr:hypothetical protein [Tannerellaceae bacterium]